MLWKNILGMVKPELLPEQLGRYPYLPIWGTPLTQRQHFFSLQLLSGGQREGRKP